MNVLSTNNQPHPPLVAILAGGLGTRLQPLIADVPKSLAQIAGQPFLFLLLRKLSALGIQKILLLTGYKHEQILTACGDGQAFNLEISYSHESKPLGTAGALVNAAAHLQQEKEFILLNGDTYLNAPLSDFISQPIPAGFLANIGVLKNEKYARYGSVQWSADGRIEAFREKQPPSTGYINAGIYKLSSEIINIIPRNTFCSLEKEIFPHIIAKNSQHGLQAYHLQGELHDIGTPESYTAFNQERMSL